MPLADLQQIESHLGTMRSAATPDGRLDAFRRLLAHLNYDVTRKPLRVDLTTDIRKQFVDGPTIVATAGADEGFLVIHTTIAGALLPRLAERAMVTALLKDYPYALFVFSNADHSRWHLLNVKIARKTPTTDAADENRDGKLRRLHRRISVSVDDRLRTAIERIAMLDVGVIQPELYGVSPLSIQAAHDDAFDVEAVTKAFFKEYARVFDYVEDAITGIRGPDKRRLFTQRLFNRLMFIAFIQKKGWLKFPGMADNEYLDALWRDYGEKKKADSNFYDDRLSHLFFRGLNNPSHVDLLATNRGKSTPDSFLQRRIGDVPYLNGGLFEKSDDGTDESDAGITIPDKAINAVLNELFDRFNFTVTESTPLDVEVAVDPEMLGKVFEELVIGRHESGSYYTPKPIVSFMCREALKGHLETRCPDEVKEAIASFVDSHDASNLADGEAVLDALKKIRCCDPACGSGAYLLGMMHELLDLRACLFASNSKLDPVKTYERKLEIIETNVYGVDLDPFAVNIARLRLWLSLAVDFDGTTPPPLPNLDFKIESGDSLAAPDPSEAGQLQLHKQMIEDFLALKREYLMSHSVRKKELKKQIDKAREKIAAWTHSQPLPENAFDWQVEFAEVFIGSDTERGGFDVVLANPPYVRQELIKDQKPTLKANFPLVFTGVADLYVFFYARALQCLRPGGVMAFISSNKWFRAGYGKKLREHIANTTAVRSIVDFHDLPVFETAIAYPMIFVAANRVSAEGETPLLAEPPDLEPPYPDVAAVVATHGHRMPTTALGRDGTWHLATSSAADRLKTMRAAGPTLGTTHPKSFFRGVVTGLNEAFYVSEDVIEKWIVNADLKAKYLRAAIHGEDARRYGPSTPSVRLLRLPDGMTLELMGHDLGALSFKERSLLASKTQAKAWQIFKDYMPSVASHLERFKDAAEVREDRGDFWWELRPCDYYEVFSKPKIVFPQTGKEGRFTLDRRGVDLDQTVYTVATDDLFLLATLNSEPVRIFLSETTALARGGYLRFLTQYLKTLPVPAASPADREAIAALAQKCLDARGEGCAAWEKEIDERVAALYGL